MRLSLLIACLPLAACSPSEESRRGPDDDITNLTAVDREAMVNARAAADAAEAAKAAAAAKAALEAAALNDTAIDGDNAQGAAPEPAGAAADKRSTARYRCMDGTKITISFDRENDRATVERAGKRVAVLQQERAASGVWYKGQGHELRGKGYDMTFTQPNLPPLACTTIR